MKSIFIAFFIILSLGAHAQITKAEFESLLTLNNISISDVNTFIVVEKDGSGYNSGRYFGSNFYGVELVESGVLITEGKVSNTQNYTWYSYLSITRIEIVGSEVTIRIRSGD